MTNEIEIQITVQKGMVPNHVKDVIADMIRDYLIEQEIFTPQVEQLSFLKEV